MVAAYIPNLESIRYLVYLDTTTPINNFKEIVDNVLNKQLLESVKNHKLNKHET